MMRSATIAAVRLRTAPRHAPITSTVARLRPKKDTTQQMCDIINERKKYSPCIGPCERLRHPCPTLEECDRLKPKDVYQEICDVVRKNATLQEDEESK